MKTLLILISIWLPTLVFGANTLHESASNLVPSDTLANHKYKQSITIKFDLLLDEKITQDDPRIKSIVYVATSTSNNLIAINYVNPNAEDLANRLADILFTLGATVLKPHLRDRKSPSLEQLKYVWVNILRI
ncbi:MAG: hypothetical protein ACK4M7_05790 [Burkholderiales bacterium]